MQTPGRLWRVEYLRCCCRFLGVAAVVFLAAEGLRAQQVTLSGIVVESRRGATVAGATVRVGSRPPVVTDLDGAFHFAEVSGGPHTLTVEAYGYHSRTLSLNLRADTTVRVELEPDPLVLDRLVVQARYVTVRGTIRDGETTVRVLDGQVTVYPGGQTVGANTGRFTLERVPAGQPVTLVVEAIEYLPVRVNFVPEGDTTLNFHLEVDSVALRMIAMQVERLERRARGVPKSPTALNRDDLMRHVASDVLEVIRRAVPGNHLPSARQVWGRYGCYFLDGSSVPLDRLQSLLPEEVERVEIYARGRAIRVYTRRYVHRMMGEDHLAPIGTVTGLASPFCF